MLVFPTYNRSQVYSYFSEPLGDLTINHSESTLAFFTNKSCLYIIYLQCRLVRISFYLSYYCDRHLSYGHFYFVIWYSSETWPALNCIDHIWCSAPLLEHKQYIRFGWYSRVVFYEQSIGIIVMRYHLRCEIIW